MNQVEAIEFVLHGQVDGVAITPRTIGLASFNEFNQDVQTLIVGSQRGVPVDDIHVRVEEGSYKLVAVIPLAVQLGFANDMRKLEHHGALADVDPKRAEVVRNWQERARRQPGLEFGVQSSTGGFSPISVSGATDYRDAVEEPWVAVDKYLFGTVVDMGGVSRANVHLVLESGQTVIASASEEVLRELPGNHLYKRNLLHVVAEQNLGTGRLRNIRLIRFEEYSPSYDEAELERAIEKGTQAWADVPDAAAWVRELRGGYGE